MENQIPDWITNLAKEIEKICYNEGDYAIPRADNLWIAAEEPTEKPSKKIRNNTIENIVKWITAPIDVPHAYKRDDLIDYLDDKIKILTRNKADNKRIQNIAKVKDTLMSAITFATGRGRDINNIAMNIENLIFKSNEYKSKNEEFITTICPWIAPYAGKNPKNLTRNIVSTSISKSLFGRNGSEKDVYHYLRYEIEKYSKPPITNYELLDYAHVLMNRYLNYFDDPDMTKNLKNAIALSKSLSSKNTKYSKIREQINHYKSEIEKKSDIVSDLIQLYTINCRNNIPYIDTNTTLSFMPNVSFQDGTAMYPYSLYAPRGLYVNVNLYTDKLMFAYVYDRISGNEDFEFDGKFNNAELESYYRLYTHLDRFARDMIDLTEFRIEDALKDTNN